jgi:hypothetical protein
MLNNTSEYISHPHFETAFKEIRISLQPPIFHPLILVIGPPRVGKTHLRRAIANKIRKEAYSGSITPVVEHEVLTDGWLNKGFDTAAFHRQLLRHLHDPYPNAGGYLPVQTLLGGGEEPVVMMRDNRSGRELYQSVCSRLKLEGCEVVLLDIVQRSSSPSGLKLLEWFVSFLANQAMETKIPHVVFCSYDLVLYSTILDNLNGVAKVIHFPRYQIKEELEVFKKALTDIEKRLPIPFNLGFGEMENVKAFYLKSLGCFGKVVDVVTHLTKEATFNGVEAVSLNSFKNYQESGAFLQRMNKYINDGEAVLASTDDQLYSLWSDFIGKKVPTVNNASGNESEEGNQGGLSSGDATADEAKAS